MLVHDRHLMLSTVFIELRVFAFPKRIVLQPDMKQLQ